MEINRYYPKTGPVRKISAFPSGNCFVSLDGVTSDRANEIRDLLEGKFLQTDHGIKIKTSKCVNEVLGDLWMNGSLHEQQVQQAHQVFSPQKGLLNGGSFKSVSCNAR